MRSAKKILDEMFEQGIQLFDDDGYLGWRSAQPLSQELINRLKIHKDDLLRILKSQRQQKAKPYLSDTGEFRCTGLLEPWTILDALLEVGASDEEIERHLNKNLTWQSWERWQVIKMSRSVN